MVDPEIIKAINDSVKVFGEGLCEDLQRRIDGGFASYRTNFIKAKGQWCCAKMHIVAIQVFHLNQPPEGTFGTTLQIAGHSLVYCPFCGVKLS